MCYASPGTRCTKKAREKLKEATAILQSVDSDNVSEWLEANELVRQEMYEYSMSPSGMKELKAKAELTKLQSDLDVYENTKAVRDARNGISKKITAQKKAEEAKKVEAAKSKDLREQSITKKNSKTLQERDALLAKANEKISQSKGNVANMTGLKSIDTPLYLAGGQSLNHLFDYETESSGCSGNCDDYCRCTYITGSNMNTKDVPTREVMGYYLSCRPNDVPEEYLSYAEDNLKLGDINNYEINGVNGYYGQEAEVTFVADHSLREYLSDKLNNEGLGHSPLHNYARSNGIPVKDKTPRQIVNDTLQAAGYKNIPQFTKMKVMDVHKTQLDQSTTELLDHTPEIYRYDVPENRHYETIHRDAAEAINGIFLQNTDGTYSVLADQANYKTLTRYGSSAKGLVLIP